MIAALAAATHVAHRARAGGARSRTCGTRSRKRARSRRSNSSRRAASSSRSVPASPGRMAMGQKALTWAYTRRYIEQVRALLRGEKVEVDGAIVQMLHGDRVRADVPDHDADRRRRQRTRRARGRARARRRRDDDRCGRSVVRLVLRCSRSARCSTTASRRDSERALAAAGPAHDGRVPRDVRRRSRRRSTALPGGVEWRKRLEEIPEDERHLAVHEDHLVAGHRARPPVARRRPDDGVHVDRARPRRSGRASTRSRPRARPRSSTRRWAPTCRASSRAFMEMATYGDRPSS